jgi:hypothetical protein
VDLNQSRDEEQRIDSRLPPASLSARSWRTYNSGTSSNGRKCRGLFLSGAQNCQIIDVSEVIAHSVLRNSMQMQDVKNPARLQELLQDLQDAAPRWIGLIVAIVVLAVVVKKIRALFWGDEDPAGDVQLLVEGAEEMRRTGALTEAEFRSIQSRAARRAVEVTLAQRGQTLPAGKPTSTERSEQWGNSRSAASSNEPAAE